MRAVIIMPAARLEIIAASDWYENEAVGLGDRFRDELDYQLQRLAAAPYRFPIARKDIRRGLLRRFPYALFFRERDGTIYVIACFHFKRDPMRWQDR